MKRTKWSATEFNFSRRRVRYQDFHELSPFCREIHELSEVRTKHKEAIGILWHPQKFHGEHGLA